MVSKIGIDKNPFLQLFLFIALVTVSTIVFVLIGTLLTIALYGTNLNSFQDYSSQNTIEGLKLIQLFSSIGIFIIPPIIFTRVMSKKPLAKLQLHQLGKPVNYVLIIMLMLVAMPFMSWLIEWNANIVFPDFLHGVELWMKQKETQAADLTKVFLTFNGTASFIYIMIIVAVVPALGEELLFRGVLQKIFIQWTKNPHWGIWITAFIFSAIHVQFYGFLPRMLLGALFGYLFLWSKSLWLPILGHFINNGTVVVTIYLYPESMNNADVTIFDES